MQNRLVEGLIPGSCKIRKRGCFSSSSSSSVLQNYRFKRAILVGKPRGSRSSTPSPVSETNWPRLWHGGKWKAVVVRCWVEEMGLPEGHGWLPPQTEGLLSLLMFRKSSQSFKQRAEVTYPLASWSRYSCTEGRNCKPFNPLLGETYEAAYPDNGLRFISEKCMGQHLKLAFIAEMYIEGNAFRPGVNPIGIHNVQHYVNGQVVIESARDTLESCSKAQTDSYQEEVAVA
ncbi:unnamed protein product [Camellia sinensis]